MAVRRESSKSTRYYSKRQESNVAKRLNGRVVSNSGATMFDKGDVTSDSFLIECKTKTSRSKSLTIKKEWLTKLRDEAIRMNKSNIALVFNFGDDEDYAIIDFNLFTLLKEYLESEME